MAGAAFVVQVKQVQDEQLLLHLHVQELSLSCLYKDFQKGCIYFMRHCHSKLQNIDKDI